MEKIWLKSYPAGVAADIEPNTYSSLVELFEKKCEQYADLPAFYNLGITLTYHQLEKDSRAFAAYLQTTLGLKKGDRVGIMLPNVLQYPIVLFGVLRAGLVAVNVNPLFTARELTYELKDAQVSTLIVLENFASTVKIALPSTPVKHVIIASIGDFFIRPKAWLVHFFLKYILRKIPAVHIPHSMAFVKILKQGQKLKLQKVPIASEDIAFLQYTGGTTGVSKGAMLSHRNIIANVLQEDMWFSPIRQFGKEIFISALPLYHIFSLSVNCFVSINMGGLSVLITNPRDIPSLIKDMKKFKFTAIMGVNTLFNALLKNPAFARVDFSAMKICLGGGMAVQETTSAAWQALTGRPLLAAYGLTEASPSVLVNPPEIKIFNGTVGLPLPSTDVCILDESGRALPLGEVGELAVKGPQVMLGYWQNPEETKKTFTQDGWLLTGDLASIDEKGFVKIVERKKDMIDVSGFKVYPNEIEEVLAKMPGIFESGVVGVPDRTSGEAVKAFIVRKDPALTEEEVRAFCRANLTGYKIPKYIEFCQGLPKSNVGKILRRALRENGSIPAS